MSSSSSSVSATYVNGRQLISGLSSGIDVDSIVLKSLTAEKWKLYKLQQQQQLATWKQNAYREVISEIRSFSDKYFNLTSSSNILSTKNFQQFQVSSSNVNAITAKAGTSAGTGTHKLTVSQLATAATRASSSQISKEIQGTKAANFASAAGKSFILDLDGTKKTIMLDSSVSDVATLQNVIDTAVGAAKVEVSTAADTGALVIKAAADSGVQQITLSSSSSSTSALSELGFGDGAILSNRVSASDTLETIGAQLNTPLIFDADGQVNLTINGFEFSFDKSETLNEVMTEVNQSSAGATLTYNQLTGKLTLTADTMGDGNTLAVSEADSSFLSALLDQSTAGIDAKLTLDGVALTRSSNSVTVDGVTYILQDTTSETVTIGITQDTDAIYDTISGFVEAYNSLIASLNGKLAEEYDRDYPPLTDDQKEEMTDEEIENWEIKAKTGLLANDSLMQSLVSTMRTALMDSISGLSTNLTEIGIATSTYSDKGKLIINEEKLKAAIEDDPEGISALFTQQSSSYSGTTSVRKLNATERQTRYKEEGIAYRLYDILQDNISTIRDNGGNKGLMLEKAGTTNDSSDTDNKYSKEIKEYNDKIADEEDWLDEEEERLYEKYSYLETYISNMSAQLSALSSITGS